MTFANEKELFDFLAPLNAAYAALPVAMPFRPMDEAVPSDGPSYPVNQTDEE